MSVAECNQTGISSELSVMQEYVLAGYTVSVPLPGFARYDFLAEKDGRISRIQVKTGTPFNRGRELQSCSQKPYTREDCDVLVVFNPYSSECYFFPVEHVEGLNPIRLRLTPYIYEVKSKIALDGFSYRILIG